MKKKLEDFCGYSGSFLIPLGLILAGIGLALVPIFGIQFLMLTFFGGGIGIIGAGFIVSAIILHNIY